MFCRKASPNFYFATSNSTVNPPWPSANHVPSAAPKGEWLRRANLDWPRLAPAKSEAAAPLPPNDWLPAAPAQKWPPGITPAAAQLACAVPSRLVSVRPRGILVPSIIYLSVSSVSLSLCDYSVCRLPGHINASKERELCAL